MMRAPFFNIVKQAIFKAQRYCFLNKILNYARVRMHIPVRIIHRDPGTWFSRNVSAQAKILAGLMQCCKLKQKSK